MDLITEQRLARRESILEAARQMIAEVGYEAVTVRDLAERCRVSVPTLYNQFGGKDGVLSAAIESQLLNVLNGAPLAREKPGFPRLLAVVDQCAEQLLALSAYHQRLLEAFASLDSTASVQQRVAEQLINVLSEELSRMQTRRQLASWAVPALLAEQMTSACIGAAIVWSSGLHEDPYLQPAMRYATGLVLLGVTRGAAAKTLRQRVEAAQETLVRGRAAARAREDVNLSGESATGHPPPI